VAIKYTAKPIPVKLDKNLLQRIDEMAIRMGEARSTVMRIAMRMGLEGLEKAFESNSELASLAQTAISSENAQKEGTAESVLDKSRENVSELVRGSHAPRKSRP
jgi:metal-responsive CopG/Arc/MetJ family transcriptional regulator